MATDPGGGDLDLTTDEIGPPQVTSPPLRPYDPSRDREWIRGMLALSLAVELVIFLISITWIFAWHFDQIDPIERFMGLVISTYDGPRWGRGRFLLRIKI